MAPRDAQHPSLAARLHAKLRLSKEDVLALAEWDEPEAMKVDAVNLDLQVAKGRRRQFESHLEFV
jgi:hypothetical protein